MGLVLIEVFNQRLLQQSPSSVVVHLHPFKANGKLKKNVYSLQKPVSLLNSNQQAVTENFSNRNSHICHSHNCQHHNTKHPIWTHKLKQKIKKPVAKIQRTKYPKKRNKNKSVKLISESFTNYASKNNKYLKDYRKNYRKVSMDLFNR